MSNAEETNAKETAVERVLVAQMALKKIGEILLNPQHVHEAVADAVVPHVLAVLDFVEGQQKIIGDLVQERDEATAKFTELVEDIRQRSVANPMLAEWSDEMHQEIHNEIFIEALESISESQIEEMTGELSQLMEGKTWFERHSKASALVGELMDLAYYNPSEEVKEAFRKLADVIYGENS